MIIVHSETDMNAHITDAPEKCAYCAGSGSIIHGKCSTCGGWPGRHRRIPWLCQPGQSGFRPGRRLSAGPRPCKPGPRGCVAVEREQPPDARPGRRGPPGSRTLFESSIPSVRTHILSHFPAAQNKLRLDLCRSALYASNQMKERDEEGS